MVVTPGTPLVALSIFGVIVLASVHFLAGRLHTLVGPERRPLYSVLSGVTTGYLMPRSPRDER